MIVCVCVCLYINDDDASTETPVGLIAHSPAHAIERTSEPLFLQVFHHTTFTMDRLHASTNNKYPHLNFGSAFWQTYQWSGVFFVVFGHNSVCVIESIGTHTHAHTRARTAQSDNYTSAASHSGEIVSDVGFVTIRTGRVTVEHFANLVRWRRRQAHARAPHACAVVAVCFVSRTRTATHLNHG